MKYNEFVEKTKQILGNKLPVCTEGAILYTSFENVREGDFYILGLNPGGNDEWSSKYESKCKPDETKIMKICKSLEKCKASDYNEYNEQWKCTFQPGKAPLQIRIKHLAEYILGSDIGDICCSNLIFRTTTDQSCLSLEKEADICWGVHEMLLNIIKPNVIIAFGNGDISPYRYLYNRFCHDSRKEHSVPAQHGTYRVKLFEGIRDQRPLYVLGLPHLSRYSIISEQRTILINKFLDEYVPEEFMKKR